MIQCVLRWNNERLYKVELENGKSFIVGSGKNDTLFVEELLPGQLKFTYKKGALYASGKKLRDLYTEAIGESATLQRITDELPLTICWQEAGEAAGQKYTLPYRGVVTIGRKDENNIVLDEGTVSGYQMTLRCEEGMAYLEDGGHNRQSTNGTYLNGHRIQKAKLKSGDIIDLLHLRIEVKKLGTRLRGCRTAAALQYLRRGAGHHPEQPQASALPALAAPAGAAARRADRAAAPAHKGAAV